MPCAYYVIIEADRLLWDVSAVRSALARLSSVPNTAAAGATSRDQFHDGSCPATATRETEHSASPGALPNDDSLERYLPLCRPFFGAVEALAHLVSQLQQPCSSSRESDGSPAAKQPRVILLTSAPHLYTRTTAVTPWVEEPRESKELYCKMDKLPRTLPLGTRCVDPPPGASDSLPVLSAPDSHVSVKIARERRHSHTSANRNPRKTALGNEIPDSLIARLLMACNLSVDSRAQRTTPEGPVYLPLEQLKIGSTNMTIPAPVQRNGTASRPELDEEGSVLPPMKVPSVEMTPDNNGDVAYEAAPLFLVGCREDLEGLQELRNNATRATASSPQHPVILLLRSDPILEYLKQRCWAADQCFEDLFFVVGESSSDSAIGQEPTNDNKHASGARRTGCAVTRPPALLTSLCHVDWNSLRQFQFNNQEARKEMICSNRTCNNNKIVTLLDSSVVSDTSSPGSTAATSTPAEPSSPQFFSYPLQVSPFQILPRPPEFEFWQSVHAWWPPTIFEGHVVKGFGRGSAQLGIPTANLDNCIVQQGPALPLLGIFIGVAQLILNDSPLHGKESDLDSLYRSCVSSGSPAAAVQRLHGYNDAVVSFGFNPFFDNPTPTIETFIFKDFGQENFLGSRIRLIILGVVRAEANFDRLEHLIQAIQLDCEVAREFLTTLRAQDSNRLLL